MAADGENATSVPRSQLQEPLLPPTSIENDELRESSPAQSETLVDGLPPNVSILIKSLYFLDALGSSTWGRFSAIYYNLHGLNSRHIGLIEGVRSVIPTVSMLVWGVAADRFHSQKAVWLITKTVSTVVLLTLAIPYVYSSFSHILVVSIVSQLFVSSGILDAYTLDLLGTENKAYYGRYRLYASVSWGLGSVVMGWVTDNYSFEPNFVMFALLGFLMIFLVAVKVPDTSRSQDEVAEDIPSEAVAGHLSELVCLALRPRVFVFLLEVIVMGAGMATVERLLFLYLVNDLKSSTLLCGLSVGINVIFELPIFWYASKFMEHLGHDGMIMLAMFCFVARVFGYTLLTPSTKWLVLVLESMHGVTFACFWVVSTDISKVLVHETTGAFWKTAIPSSVQMLYSAVGVSLGSIVGGWAMNRYGSRVMYSFAATIVGGTLFLHVVGSVLSRLCCGGKGLLPDYQQRPLLADAAEPSPQVSDENPPPTSHEEEDAPPCADQSLVSSTPCEELICAV
eukprot:Nitzschia sp. Nitz4//scaffold1_size375055//288774//290303//NITZ4_000313-RA/size375055-processed-gene-0.457-mRNA-1//-1//CDS//3329541156//226//frame0